MTPDELRRVTLDHEERVMREEMGLRPLPPWSSRDRKIMRGAGVMATLTLIAIAFALTVAAMLR